MNAEGLTSAGGLTRKLVTFLILCIIEVALSVFVHFIDLSKSMGSDKNPNKPFNPGNENTLVIFMTGAQTILHFILIFWYFFLVWKTFMFRFGMIRKLADIFPILYLAPVNFLLFVFERALRYVS